VRVKEKVVYKFGKFFFYFEIMKKQPLNLPKGSVRAILAIITTTFVCTALFFSQPLPEYFVVIWSGIVGLYFAGRSNFAEEKIDE
jgi:hypothetical protein